MVNAKTLSGLLVFALSTGAMAGPIVLTNWNIETNSTAKYGKITGWLPNGGWADHASFAKPGNAGLGLNFGFYTVGTTETVGQVTSEIIAPNMVYKFWGFAQGGGNDAGTVPYQIGYAAVAGNLASFVLLNSSDVVTGGSWAENTGVTYTTGAAGVEIGKELIVRLGSGSGTATDIWFDNFQATATSAVPEPATIAVLGLGIAFLARRKRK
jgi:hypothetical protein